MRHLSKVSVLKIAAKYADSEVQYLLLCVNIRISEFSLHLNSVGSNIKLKLSYWYSGGQF